MRHLKVYIFAAVLTLFLPLAAFAQIHKKVVFVEHLISIGEYSTALAKIKAREKKASVNEAIVLKSLESEIYFKQLLFEKSWKTYLDAKQLYSKNDTAYIGGLYLVNSGRYQIDHQYLNSTIENLCLRVKGQPYWYAQSVIIKASLMQDQGYGQSIVKFIESNQSEFDKVASPEQNFILNIIKMKVLVKDMSYKASTKAIDSLKSRIKHSNDLNKHLSRCYYELKAEYEIAINNDYQAAAENFEIAYTVPGVRNGEYLKSKYLYYTILNFKKANKELQKQRFLREAEMITYQTVGHKDILIYDLAKAQIAHLEGKMETSNSYLSKIDKKYGYLPPYHFLSDEIEKLRYDNQLQLGNLSEASKVILRRIDSVGIYTSSPQYQKLKLEYLKHEVLYGDDFQVLEKVKRESYNSVLLNEIGTGSKEHIEYLDLFGKGFKLISKFDSSYYYANMAYSHAIKVYNSKQIAYAYYTAGMIQASMLAGVKIMYMTYLSNIESSSLKYVESDNFMYINTLEKLSQIYATIGDYNKARSVLSLSNYTAIKVIASPFSKANYQSEIGKLYLKIGRYSKAYDLLEESIEISNQYFGEDNRFKYEVLLSLSSLYNITGNFNASSDILASAYKLCLKKYTDKSLEYTEYLKSESQYFMSIGDFDKAKRSLEKAIEIQKRILPAKSVELTSTYIELAYVSSFSSDNHQLVIQLYENATAIIKETLGDNIPLYADLIKRKGEYFSLIKQYDKSTTLLNQSLTYWNKLLGEKNTNSAEILILLGNNSYANSDYVKAVDFYNRSYDIYNFKFSENHPKSTLSAGKLARAQYMLKRYNESLSLMEKVIPIHLENKNKFFSTMSFSEKSKFWSQIKDEFEFYNYLIVNHFGGDEDRIAKIYNITLSTKALLLSNTLKIKRNIFNSGDSTLILKYNEWIYAKELLLYAYSQNKEQLLEQKIDIKSLEEQIEVLEKAISKKSEMFSNQEKSQKFTWQNVAEVLKTNEYVLEIVKIRKFNKYFTDSSQYLVMMLNYKNKNNLEYVLLNNGKELDTRYLSYYRNAVKFNVEDKYTYQKFWKPIKDKIPDGAVVYISPDGSYCQVNLETAHNGSNYAIDDNQFLYLTNSVDLATRYSFSSINSKNKDLGKIVLCGDPEFYANKINSGSVESLAGTEREVQEIKKIATTHYPNKDIMVFLNEDVLEDSIKKIKSPLIFHIATHGYFKETKYGTNEFKSNPLLNSGLMLGYSGDILEGGTDAYVNQKSGILTAYEVSNMDFDNTKLVVLSACETGKGEVQTGEGVMGLVRAFTIAGGKAIVNSLFKVEDEATVKFMSLFYTSYMNSNNEKDAIIFAKKEMKKLYPQPVNWGSFILYEAGH